MRIIGLVSLLGCLFTSAVCAQQTDRAATKELWAAVEADVLAEINLLRRDPAAYAEAVLQPMKERGKRVPRDETKPFKALTFPVTDSPLDYVDVAEGDDRETAMAVLDEAIAALNESPKLSELSRNVVPLLDQDLRFSSQSHPDLRRRIE